MTILSIWQVRVAALLLLANCLTPALAQERDRGTPALMQALAQGGYVIIFATATRTGSKRSSKRRR